MHAKKTRLGGTKARIKNKEAGSPLVREVVEKISCTGEFLRRTRSAEQKYPADQSILTPVKILFDRRIRILRKVLSLGLLASAHKKVMSLCDVPDGQRTVAGAKFSNVVFLWSRERWQPDRVTVIEVATL